MEANAQRSRHEAVRAAEGPLEGWLTRWGFQALWEQCRAEVILLAEVVTAWVRGWEFRVITRPNCEAEDEPFDLQNVSGP